jgi:imidazolonepropionase-like amidohydrolase
VSRPARAVRLRRALVAAGALAAAPGCAARARPASADATPPALWDAHTHLSLYGPAALDSLRAHGVVAVRDLGGDLETTLRWRDEIARGVRAGPRVYTAGVILDGPKDGATPRWTVRDEADAVRAVDSLARRRVDFVKTHNGLARPAYFAVLRRARERGLRVASHLPRGVPAWEAADSGASSIEHAAESLLASPIYAGVVRTADEAIAWWRSPAGDSAVARLARSGVSVTPTLALYAANAERPADPAQRAARRRALPFLVELTGRLHRAGVPLLAGSDVATPDAPAVPGRSLHQELALLRRAGLSDAAARAAAGANVRRWLGVAP